MLHCAFTCLISAFSPKPPGGVAIPPLQRRQTSTITSAVLDRLLHHAETVIIEGNSYRMKDQIDNP